MSTAIRGSAVPVDVPSGDPRPRRRWGLLLFILVLLVAIGLAFLIWQPATRFRAQQPTDWPTATGPGAIPTYSSAQGAQDAPRSEIMSGRSRDYDACMETLKLRRVVWETAKDTCTKMVIGLYGN